MRSPIITGQYHKVWTVGVDGDQVWVVRDLLPHPPPAGVESSTHRHRDANLRLFIVTQQTFHTASRVPPFATVLSLPPQITSVAYTTRY